MGYVGGGSVGYRRYTVSCSGILLRRAIKIAEIHARKIESLHLWELFTHMWWLELSLFLRREM